MVLWARCIFGAAVVQLHAAPDPTRVLQLQLRQLKRLSQYDADDEPELCLGADGHIQ